MRNHEECWDQENVEAGRSELSRSTYVSGNCCPNRRRNKTSCSSEYLVAYPLKAGEGGKVFSKGYQRNVFRRDDKPSHVVQLVIANVSGSNVVANLCWTDSRRTVLRFSSPAPFIPQYTPSYIPRGSNLKCYSTSAVRYTNLCSFPQHVVSTAASTCPWHDVPPSHDLLIRL